MSIGFVAVEETYSLTDTLTIAIPTGTAQNDAMVCFIRQRNNLAITPPAGWSEVASSPQQVGTGGSSYLRSACYWKVATASEPANYSWTVASAVTWQGVIVTYSGTDTTLPYEADGGDTGTDGSTPLNVVAPSITTVTDDDMLVCAWLSYNNPLNTTSWTLPGGFTQRYAGSVRDRDAMRVAEMALPASGATGAQQANCAFINGTWGAFAIALVMPRPITTRYGPRVQII